MATFKGQRVTRPNTKAVTVAPARELTDEEVAAYHKWVESKKIDARRARMDRRVNFPLERA